MGSRKDDFRISIAAYRLAVVFEVKVEEAKGIALPKAVVLVSAREHLGAKGKLRRFSARTINRWIKAFDKDQIKGLCNQRQEVASFSLSDSLIKFLKDVKQEDPEASIPEVIRRARLSNIIGVNEVVNRVTVYRACLKLNLPLMRKSSVKYGDMRRFAYEHRMQMVLCDGKHFRVGGSRRKRVALFYIDDATRFVLHVVVGTSETSQLFLTGFYELILKYGLMSAIYFDHGSGFEAGDVKVIAAHLGVALIYGKVRYPEGHGKIERFNQTAKADVLRSLDKNPNIDPDCMALKLRLQHYLDEMYNPREHEGIQNDNPKNRFFSDSRQLKYPISDQTLRAHFIITKDKRVSKDNLISERKTFYEVPFGHARTWVKLYIRVLEDSLAVLHEGVLVDIHPVDLGLNARSKRMGRNSSKEESSKPPAKTAAEMAFEKDCGPMVGPDGNYFKNQTDEE